MDTYQKRERREWLVAATVLTMLTWLMICLLSACKAKPAADKPAPTRTILITDTTRVQILHRVNTARTQVQILKERNQPTTNAYEAAAAAYDTVDVDLP